MHAEMWVERLLASEEGRARLRDSLLKLSPYALGVLDAELLTQFRERVRAVGVDESAAPVSRGTHTDELAELWEEMTVVRRAQPAGVAW